mmetsp:Transcript_15925/g.19750  ORF Transcript_15925/g.19750 Transcript_15925/m.19750 type:complete len:201 (+) Transcript_15925:280-882(+)|eukprot:CAMPEP_0204859140 /NCGR_PEP_ID=MMETSP1347-20130617/23510_1 /ASSEMBLY_ACC=CAM_ASM_000690 /TAXON_ID=215587 /ORGANISM="Aplanochytrium stocchinoi, Strain GSBS06" /LENGTH=200 /DNA_ID=CAMNT_0052007539 /DNA_START=154 /DNA_END=756 /DNA_ORIENTATION=+
MMRDDGDVSGLGPVTTRDDEFVFDNMEEPEDMKKNVFYTQYDDDDEEEIKEKTPLEQAIPIDKIKNGATNAWEFLSWSAKSVKEQAAKVNEQLEQSENYNKLMDSYEKNVKPKLSEVREGANSLYEKSKPKLEEFRENASQSAHNLYEKSQPALNSLQEKSLQTMEACKPTLIKAKESAATGLSKAYESTRDVIDSIGKN